MILGKPFCLNQGVGHLRLLVLRSRISPPGMAVLIMVTVMALPLTMSGATLPSQVRMSMSSSWNHAFALGGIPETPYIEEFRGQGILATVRRFLDLIGTHLIALKRDGGTVTMFLRFAWLVLDCLHATGRTNRDSRLSAPCDAAGQ